MKITFRDTHESHEAVMPAQEEMKHFQRKKVPVKKVIIIGLLVVLTLAGALFLFSRSTLYTYGVVSGSTESLQALFPTEIREVYVKRGDIVRQGDVLFLQFPVDGMAMIKRAEADLNTKMAEYDRVIKTMGPSFETMTQRELVTMKHTEVELLKLRQRDAALTREQTRRDGDFAVVRLKTQYLAKKERYENLLTLFELDAATRSQVADAEAEMTLLYTDYTQARERYDQIVKRNRIARAQEKEEMRKYESLAFQDTLKQKADLDALRSEITAARTYLDQLMKKYGTAHYRAPFDAIITEVSINNGSVINTGEPMLTCVSLSRLWIDVYVEAEKADRFTEERTIRILPVNSSQSIPGKLSQRGRVQVRVPEVLSGHMPGITRAVYFHVAVDGDDALLPGTVVRVVVK